MLIDATIPPPHDTEARAAFERIRPPNPQLKLKDFAAKESLELVNSLSPTFFGSALLRATANVPDKGNGGSSPGSM
jgi:hypothetical protein